MFPTFDFTEQIETIETETAQVGIDLGRVIMMNFDTGKARIVTLNGIPVEATTVKDKVKMYVQMLLRTKLGKYKVYDNTDFGMTYFNYIGNSTLPIGFINSELKREIEEKLSILNAVESVTAFSASRSGTFLNVLFQINLKNGENVAISEVI